MIERQGNVWNNLDGYDALCITTNGFTRKDGTAVMGRGIAKQFSSRYPGADKRLGDLIRENGNVTQVLGTSKSLHLTFVSLPVKHNWWEEADVTLIHKSLGALVDLTVQMTWRRVALPRPGCGNGSLDWERDGIKRLCAGELQDDIFEVWSL